MDYVAVVEAFRAQLGGAVKVECESKDLALKVIASKAGRFAGWHGDSVAVLGGNQGDAVSVALFDGSRILGVRRLGPVAA